MTRITSNATVLDTVRRALEGYGRVVRHDQCNAAILSLLKGAERAGRETVTVEVPLPVHYVTDALEWSRAAMIEICDILKVRRHLADAVFRRNSDALDAVKASQ